MAAIKPKKTSSTLNPILEALTLTALTLPGIVASKPVLATEGDAGFQYGHYEEGTRDLFGVKSRFTPIEVDTLQGTGNFKVLDRTKFSFTYVQDTWSGATPIATAPTDLRGNRTRAVDSVSGATPIINGQLFFDRDFNVLNTDGFGTVTSGIDKQLVHTLSSASPETRKQGNFKLGYEWDEAEADIGGGVSVEHDYESQFISAGGRMDFNQKLTTLNFGVNYTGSDINSKLDHDAVPYITTDAFKSVIKTPQPGEKIISASRNDWGANLGLTQVLTKNALLSGGVGYTYSSGYMENPYKVVEIAFIDPALQLFAPPGGHFGDVRAFLEQRPDTRHQFNSTLRYTHYIPTLDAALRFDYRYFHDDWEINAHTFEASWGQGLGNGWMATPRVRYYSQDAADFYVPYLISQQGYRQRNPELLPANFSSDHRLSGYGALSGGITLSKKFTKGITFEADFEYYSHAGDLKLGGDGENKFADFNYFTANAAVKVNLAALSSASFGDDHEGHGHHDGHNHNSPGSPAGLMFEHMLSKSGDIMIGYRYMFSEQDGDMLYGANSINDGTVVSHACPGTTGCQNGPEDMLMHMHMLNLMYAPTDWLNLMLMPSFTDMSMKFRGLDGAPPASGSEHQHGDGHSTGGVGDTGMYAMVKLFDTVHHHMHLSLGAIAPTGDYQIKLRDTHQSIGGFIHYGMQLGSGTWDFNPSLTYTGKLDRWFWGGQLSGIKRLEARNDAGYALGDMLQATVWGGYNLLDWLAASVRGIHTTQGEVHGRFNGPHPTDSPMDHTANYGGDYWDLGLGLNAVIPGGDLMGNRLSIEWLQPVQDNTNGYQLEREGSFVASWSYAF